VIFSLFLAVGQSALARSDKNRGVGRGLQNQEGIGGVENSDSNQAGDEDQDNEKSSLGNKNRKINAQQNRNRVANFVLNLLKVAEREKGGIGEEVREIAREQNASTETIATALDKIQKRNRIKTFFAGADYKNLGALRSEMIHVRNRLEKLNRLMENMEEGADKTEIQNQIEELE